LSGRGLCDELITRLEESYRLCCVVVCDLETSRTCAPYIYDISSLRVNIHSKWHENLTRQLSTRSFHSLNAKKKTLRTAFKAEQLCAIHWLKYACKILADYTPNSKVGEFACVTGFVSARRVNGHATFNKKGHIALTVRFNFRNGSNIRQSWIPHNFTKI